MTSALPHASLPFDLTPWGRTLWTTALAPVHTAHRPDTLVGITFPFTHYHARPIIQPSRHSSLAWMQQGDLLHQHALDPEALALLYTDQPELMPSLSALLNLLAHFEQASPVLHAVSDMLDERPDAVRTPRLRQFGVVALHNSIILTSCLVYTRPQDIPNPQGTDLLVLTDTHLTAHQRLAAVDNASAFWAAWRHTFTPSPS